MEKRTTEREDGRRLHGRSPRSGKGCQIVRRLAHSKQDGLQGGLASTSVHSFHHDVESGTIATAVSLA